jgi:glycerophosphoryl diester phosphodiesterase
LTTPLAMVAAALVCLCAAAQSGPGSSGRKVLIAHRGASAYAPEHTLASYRLALQQGADFVEQDLQISKDGVLVCLHDLTLERTTDVEAIFPERARVDGRGRKSWPVSDFTLAELKRLDAGVWFKPEFQGQRIPTFQEAIDLVAGHAGLYPETKGPEVYGGRGFDMERLLLTSLERSGLDRPGSRSPVIIQSFSAASLQKLRTMGTPLPLVLLVSDLDADARTKWLTDAGLHEASRFAQGLGPAKSLVMQDSTLVPRAHAAGLTVTPYTFRAAGMAPGTTVKEEMADFLYRIGVDALFTDNPDQFPRR